MLEDRKPPNRKFVVKWLITKLFAVLIVFKLLHLYENKDLLALWKFLSIGVLKTFPHNNLSKGISNSRNSCIGQKLLSRIVQNPIKSVFQCETVSSCTLVRSHFLAMPQHSKFKSVEGRAFKTNF